MNRSMPTNPVALPDPESYQNYSTLLSRSNSMPTSERNGLTIDNMQRSSLGGIARHTLGIGLLLVTVILWTASSFLASVSSVSHRRRILTLFYSSADKSATRRSSRIILTRNPIFLSISIHAFSLLFCSLTLSKDYIKMTGRYRRSSEGRTCLTYVFDI